MNLWETIESISPPDERAMQEAKERWDSIAKPLHSLGKLEDCVCRIAGITGRADVSLRKKALAVFCADNGVVEEGVTQTGQEVTAIVAENFLSGDTSAAVMCQKVGVDLYPIDIGMKRATKVPDYHVCRGTKNMVKTEAMTREEAIQAIETGIHLAEVFREKGYDIVATGEMGIGNTTTSSAVASVLLSCKVEEIAGRGAGLSSEGLERKLAAIKKAICLHLPDPEDPVDVLHKVGGLDLAGLTGLYLGCAAQKIPVLMDGFISATAALAAVKMCEKAGDYILATHCSREPGMEKILEYLGKTAVLYGDMCLGEGTGAVAFLPVLEMGVEVYEKMCTFSQIRIESYKELK